ncbi:uncharacterized protein LOC127872720 isoform X2 [Dreissena polymorpha]|uniref:uncharacterized protein LOC127872720 isoform X2 n=1 Tax=Dreissena polymorpha TaxID=45954 RepID=UPI002265013B|nr:uncharacterized protein LOC127872720 isoform X2 [Dreissena polymorpha]
MASLADVFTEKERTNWLKAWLAVDIAKSGLDNFAETEAKTLHANIYNAAWSSVQAPAVCIGCHTANLLKCPTQGICNKRGANSSCKAMHDTAAKQPRPCPTNVCNKVLDEIKTLHKFASPSWKNTRAQQWAQNPWQIAKAYLPPDGYTGKSSVQDTDFNGIISFMMNCKHFDSKFSFPIAPEKNNPPCLLTKAREIGRTVRHSSQCKLTDADLQVIFTTLTNLLNDPTCLAHDVASQEAVNKLAKLQNDRLKITTEEMMHLLGAVEEKLKEVDNLAEKTLHEIRESIQRYMNDLREHKDTCKQQLDEHTETGEMKLDEHTEKCEMKLDEHTGACEMKLDKHTETCEVKLDEHTEKCEMKLDEHTGACEMKLDKHTETCEVKLDEHTEKCEDKLDEHTEQLKIALDKHSRHHAESNYEQSCEDLRRRLIEHYNDNSSFVPLSILNESLDKRITDIYASPKIHRIDIKKDGSRKIEEPVNFYKEMFYKHDHSNRRIYVQGEPGSGKSTFAAKLVHDWCHKYQPLLTVPNKNTAFNDLMTIQTFKFLFFISLRNVRGQKDISQMIKDQLVDQMYSEDDLDGVYTLLKTIIQTEQCLVVRDGLDEWMAPDGCNLAEPSMTGLRKDKVTVLTTARPWKLADGRIKNSQIDILMEIQGVSDPDIFCANILGCIIDDTKDLDNTVKEFQNFVNKRELKSLSSSPMLYTLVICTWVDTMKEEEHSKEYSLCALYTSLLESLCKKTTSTTGYFNNSNPSPVDCFSNTSYLQPNIELLDKLAVAACKLLFSCERETSIVFSDMALSNYFSGEEFTLCKTFALKAGILTNRKDKNRTGSSNSFIHKTIQEFLAAYYIACNTYVIDDVVAGYLKRYNDSYLDLSQVFIFLCGMNTIAANALSGLMDEYHVASCRFCDHWPCELQNITETGIREAEAGKQNTILPKLSHVSIDDNNIRYSHRVLSATASNIQSLHINTRVLAILGKLPSFARGEPKSHFVLNLASCHKLKRLRLNGDYIYLTDSADLVTSELPVVIVLNHAEPARCGDPPPVLPSIQYIDLCRVKCSSSWLRSLFSTLLTLDHEVQCIITRCYITSTVEGSVRESTEKISTNIRTGFNNTFYVQLSKDCLWFRKHLHGFGEALHGLNIKWLRINVEYAIENRSDFVVFLYKSLPSLSSLETLDVCVNDISPDLCEYLHSLNIKSVTLSQSGRWRGLIVNNVSQLSQVLISPTQMEAIIIDVNAHPDLLEALCGRNINSLCLYGSGEHLEVKNVSALCRSLSSLKQLDKLDVIVNNDCPGLWQALHGLNIKSLSLSGGKTGLIVHHVSALAQLLASLIHLETLSIKVSEYNLCLWEAIHGLNIKCLSLCFLGQVDHISSLSQSLASLTNLETLCVKFSCAGVPRLLETGCGLNITCLSIEANGTCQQLWEALIGLNIQSLSMSGFLWKLFKKKSIVPSFSQLQMLTLYVSNFYDIQLPQSLKYLNIYWCGEEYRFPLSDIKMDTFSLSNIVGTLSACTQRIEIKLECGVKFYDSIEGYKHILERLKNVKMTRFLIYTWKPSIGNGSDWCVQKVVVGVDGNHDDDIGDDKLYKQFIDDVADLHRISVRFRIN